MKKKYAKNNINFLGINLNNVNDYLKGIQKNKEKLILIFVVSTGGFVSIPTLLACRSRKKRIYIIGRKMLLWGLLIYCLEIRLCMYA
ncbi:MAG: hypothetical protein L6U99_12750 [Clostridium sp.]|nr:MAG: hypothetical protein L6U99_12750 [Clostridium sp.]